MARFDRVARVIVGVGGQQGTAIDDLRITFDIQKTDRKDPNQSKIVIWNLAQSTRQRFEQRNMRVQLLAGYQEEGGPVPIFLGNVVACWHQMDGADIKTNLDLGEGQQQFRDSVVSLAYGRGATNTQIIRDVAGQMGLAVTMPDDVPQREWRNGWSYHGAARGALDQATRGSGLSWSIQNGGLQVIRTGGSTNREVVELRADSGLIGSAERIRKAAQERVGSQEGRATPRPAVAASDSSRQFDGWRVRSLLLPQIVPGDRVKLKTRFVDGVFTARDVHHIGDTMGGDWQTELRLAEPTAATTDQRAQRPTTSTQTRQARQPAGGSSTFQGGALVIPGQTS